MSQQFSRFDFQQVPESKGKESSSVLKNSGHKNSDLLTDFDISDLKIGDLPRVFKRQPKRTKGFLSNLKNNTPANEEESPIRDWMISSAVHLSVTEVISLCMPARIPAYVAVGTAHTLAEGARIVKPCIDQLSQDKDVADLWDRQVLLSGEGSSFAGTIALTKGLLTTTQVPSDLLYAVHDKVTSVMSRVCDKLHLTDQNIVKVTVRALELMAESTPDCTEQKFGRLLCEEYMTTEVPK